jgi:hypothetical protein
VNEDGNEFHGLDDDRIHKKHGEQRISAVATQKDNRVGVATTREIPVDSHGVVICNLLINIVYGFVAKVINGAAIFLYFCGKNSS